MFTYQGNQNNLTPNNNNCCGGFALAATLIRLNTAINHTGHNFNQHGINLPVNAPEAQGTYIYHRIQQAQAGYAGARGIFLGQTLLNNTRMSMPSALVSVARAYGRVVNVHYTQAPIVQLFGQAMVNDETQSIVGAGGTAQTEATPLATIIANIALGEVLIVLVNNGQHWLAVDRDANGYHVYDPAGVSTAANRTAPQIVTLLTAPGTTYTGLRISIS